MYRLICLLLLLSAQTLPARETLTLQNNWKFSLGKNDKAAEISFDDSGWQTVFVPHDWAIAGPFIPDGDGNTGKLPWKGEAWYRRQLEIDQADAGKQIYLLFDGVMAFPEVYVNGRLAGKWDYGYNSFYLDITDFIRPGAENVLAVHVDTRNHDSRWYPGAGIYRKVQLIKVHPLHVGIWGTYVSTPIVKPHYADVRIQSTLINRLGQTVEDVRVEQVIRNAAGAEVARRESLVDLRAGETRVLENTLTLSNPECWDLDHPVLYEANTRIYYNGQLVDTQLAIFGVRTMRFTADHGFYLNDRRVQLKGVNLHHDHGPLGAAFYLRAMERQLEIMQSMGCNAVRTSHNTAAPELLDLCDRMGLLVFNEVFDKYDSKADITDSTDFEEFARRNIHNFVVRDRNHPSLFLWSVGNEIGDVQANQNRGFERLHTMVNYVRKYDPTRPVTLVCDNQNSAALRHFDYYDVHSWNYGRRYSLARQLEPNKAVVISESASTLSTRGFYELPLPAEKTAFTKALQVSSYDLLAPWWAELADDDFMWQQEEEYIAGEFVWTGFDYLGEPTPYTNDWAKENGLDDRAAARSSYFGIVDLCGIPKDRFFLYKSYWKPDETTIHILPHWNWADAGVDSVPVFVYTNGDCAELFLNGRSLGKRCKNPKSTKSVERFRLMWLSVPYEPGELKAVAYKEGAVLGERHLNTAGAPVAIRLNPDRTRLRADGMDLSYILLEAVDAEGNACPLSENWLDIELNGPARIAGVGNGNPQSLAPFQAGRVQLFYGKAMLIVGSVEGARGTVGVSVSGKGLQDGRLTLNVD